MAHPTLPPPAPSPPPASSEKSASPLDDPLSGDALSPRRRSEHPTAFDSIAFVEGPRVLTITWLPPAADV